MQDQRRPPFNSFTELVQKMQQGQLRPDAFLPASEVRRLRPGARGLDINIDQLIVSFTKSCVEDAIRSTANDVSHTDNAKLEQTCDVLIDLLSGYVNKARLQLRR